MCIDWVCPHVCASAPSRSMRRVAHGAQNVPVIVPFGSPHFGAQVPPLLTHSIPPFSLTSFPFCSLFFWVNAPNIQLAPRTPFSSLSVPVGVAVLIWLPLRVWEYEHECDCVCFLLTVSHRLSDSRALTKTLGCHGGNNQTPNPSLFLYLPPCHSLLLCSLRAPLRLKQRWQSDMGVSSMGGVGGGG